MLVCHHNSHASLGQLLLNLTQFEIVTDINFVVGSLLDMMGLPQALISDVKRELKCLLSDADFVTKMLSCDVNKIDITEWWKAVGKKYSKIGDVLPYVFALPNSNAQVERLFSMLKQVHTPVRNSLELDTINSILAIKCNKEGSLFELDISEECIRQCKKATKAYNDIH